MGKIEKIITFTGVNYAGLAKRFGVSKPTLWAWRKGRTPPNSNHQQLIDTLYEKVEFAKKIIEAIKARYPNDKDLDTYLMQFKKDI
jgi:transcriptional regulator with XRE-family HTH domain